MHDISQIAGLNALDPCFFYLKKEFANVPPEFN
jgi:hypothetical protein